MLPPEISWAAVFGVLGDEMSLSWFRNATDLMPRSFDATTVETIESLRTTSGANLARFPTSLSTCLHNLAMMSGKNFVVSFAEKEPESVNTTSTRGRSLHGYPFALSHFVTSPELENITSFPDATSLSAKAAIHEAWPIPEPKAARYTLKRRSSNREGPRTEFRLKPLSRESSRAASTGPNARPANTASSRRCSGRTACASRGL